MRTCGCSAFLTCGPIAISQGPHDATDHRSHNNWRLRGSGVFLYGRARLLWEAVKKVPRGSALASRGWGRRGHGLGVFQGTPKRQFWARRS